MSTEPSFAATFLLAQYRTALSLILGRLDIRVPDRITDMDMNVQQLAMAAVSAVASGKPGPVETGTAVVAPSEPADGLSDENPTEENALAIREGAELGVSVDSVLRAAIQQIAIDVGVQAPFPEDITVLAQMTQAAVREAITVDADKLAAMGDQLSSSQVALSRVNEILRPGETVDGDALVETVQKWSTLKVRLKRRVAECFKEGMPTLGDELAGYVAMVSPNKEYGAWWKTLPVVRARWGSPLHQVLPHVNETSPADPGTRDDRSPLRHRAVPSPNGWAGRDKSSPDEPGTTCSSDDTGSSSAQAETPRSPSFRIFGSDFMQNLRGLVGYRIAVISETRVDNGDPAVKITLHGGVTIIFSLYPAQISDGHNELTNLG